MSIKIKGRITQVGSSLRVIIPKEIAQQLNLKRGDAVELWVNDHSMLMEKKTFIYDAVWGFEEDILEERKSLVKEFESHVSQSIGGAPLHKYKGQLTIQNDKIILKRENIDSSLPSSSVFSTTEITDMNLGWDQTLRRWKDTRGLIKPLKITFQVGSQLKKLYLYAKKPEDGIYGEQNTNVFKILRKSM